MDNFILVTGAHRSGTTWIGKMIDQSKRVFYIHEPFNINKKETGFKINVPYWFFELTDDCINYNKEFQDILNYKYDIFQKIQKSKDIKETIKIIRNYFSTKYHKFFNKRILIKDPLAIMSAEYLFKKYSCKVIVSIRNPASIISSYIMKNWEHDFSHFLKQEHLINNRLSKFKKQIKKFSNFKRSILEQGILLYKIIYSVVDEYQSKYPEWLFVKHENLTSDPKKYYEIIFRYLNIEYDYKLLEKIEYSTRNNPKVYKNRLNSKQIERIRNETKSIWKKFYDEI